MIKNTFTCDHFMTCRGSGEETYFSIYAMANSPAPDPPLLSYVPGIGRRVLRECHWGDVIVSGKLPNVHLTDGSLHCLLPPYQKHILWRGWGSGRILKDVNKDYDVWYALLHTCSSEQMSMVTLQTCYHTEAHWNTYISHTDVFIVWICFSTIIIWCLLQYVHDTDPS